MFKFFGILCLVCVLSSCPLLAVKSGKFKCKQASLSARCGTALGQSIAESINYHIQRQRELENYEKILEIQYKNQMKFHKELFEFMEKYND
jgi:hypothetical protein